MPKPRSNSSPLPLPSREPLFELDEAAFAVPERVLLGPLSFTLPGQTVIGLIGHNGSGKSTLVKLLARQQSPSSGTIRFAGSALSGWRDRAFARKVAYLKGSGVEATRSGVAARRAAKRRRGVTPNRRELYTEQNLPESEPDEEANPCRCTRSCRPRESSSTPSRGT